MFKLAARAALWRTTLEPRQVGLPALLGVTAALAAVRIALQYLAAGPVWHFNPYGLNAIVAWLAVALAIAACFVRPAYRATALTAMVMLSILADIAAAAIETAAPLIASATAVNAFWARAGTAAAVFTVEIVWWIGALVCVLRSLEPRPYPRLVTRAVALWAALLVANAMLPHAPVFVGSDFDIRNANWWEYLYARYGHNEIARIEQAQPALLKTQVDALAPPRQDATNVYAIGLAGMDQDVFVKELDGALAAVAAVLPIRDRSIRLINSHETIANLPLANPENFAAAVQAVAGAMNKERDVLVLIMTSHGDSAGVGLQLPGHPPSELTPQEVAAALDREGVKNRVVIVSACFSGIFLPPLANDDTIVMTAADAKSTSFGCAPERDWTYFGDAFFRQSLRPGTDFQHAFAHARILIQGWELMDRLAPSNPQGSFGPALVARLAPLFQLARDSR